MKFRRWSRTHRRAPRVCGDKLGDVRCQRRRAHGGTHFHRDASGVTNEWSPWVSYGLPDWERTLVPFAWAL